MKMANFVTKCKIINWLFSTIRISFQMLWLSWNVYLEEIEEKYVEKIPI